MSSRLGAALAVHLKRTISENDRSFVLIEGVTVALAEGLSRAWNDQDMPLLAVVSASPARFGQHAMATRSGTQLRNDSPRGVVLVLCDGEQVPDRQSLGLFESVSPSVLLETPEGLAILARQQPSIDLDGALRAIREAINQCSPAIRPSATAVANFFDAVAGQNDPLRLLTLIGGFRDSATSGIRVDAQRIGDNLALAARRTSEEVLRASAYVDIRKRTEQVLGRRPQVRTNEQRVEISDGFMAALISGNADVLSLVDYDEAREIFEQRTVGLPDIVRREIEAFQVQLLPGSHAVGLPWPTYLLLADDLQGTLEQRRDAALQFCALDDSQSRGIFTRQTRQKLERLMRDRAIDGSSPSAPEVAIIRARQQLGGAITRVQLVSPLLSAGGTSQTRTGAGRIVTLACARLRLGALFAKWEDAGVDVDGLLLRAVDEEDLGDILAAFDDVQLSQGNALPALQLRLHSSDSATVQVNWRPDLDDAAMLRAAILFAETPSLSLASTAEPTLHAFCGRDNATAEVEVEEFIDVARDLQRLARSSLDHGLNPRDLASWTSRWADACAAAESASRNAFVERISLAGTVRHENVVALTAFSPLKSEWLSQYLKGLWELCDTAIRDASPSSSESDTVTTAQGVARTTASHYPAFLRVRSLDRALLPSSEGRVWSVFGGSSSQDESGQSGDVLSGVVLQLLELQPEAAGHLRCLAWGAGAADLLVREAVDLLGRKAGKSYIGRIEIFCVGDDSADKPSATTLAIADDQLKNERDVLELRYVHSLQQAVALLGASADAPAVHLALVTGLSAQPNALQVESREVKPPALDEDVLFTPRVWQRPGQDRRTLLMSPTASTAGLMWLRVQQALDDGWPPNPDEVLIPEVRSGALDFAEALQTIHDLSLWVATMDRYATRDSLEHAMGSENIAILHQERRLSGDSPLSLVISQKSGGPADRAIGRSLRAAGIVNDRDVALSIGTDLRKVASQGYGILALQAATSGAGINELVGHVVAFSLLATKTTPWPLPPGCRVILVSLDEYRQWFPGKRADLLAIALDPRNQGVHVATIEVKARRSDERDAAAGALDQLVQTLAVTKWAAYPVAGSIHSRLWLNRIAEAAYSVARESRFKLDADELSAIEAFRLGRGTLEWAGVGLVFGPNLEPTHMTYRTDIAHDIVPVVLHTVPLTEALLRTATQTRLTELRTAESDRPPLESSRTRRRPETGSLAESTNDSESPPSTELDNDPQEQSPDFYEGTRSEDSHPSTGQDEAEPGAARGTHETQESPTLDRFVAPILGWDAITGDEVRWHPAGSEQDALQNGHAEVWGSSGMGKTQFMMALLGQLSRDSGATFGIADFKNDYSDETGFPELGGAQFIDLWNDGAPYNPLALESKDARAIQSAIIEIRDAVDEAVRSVGARLGVRQRAKLEVALREAYSVIETEERWPTLQTLDDQIDEDLRGVIGDLTRNQLFRTGEPLGEMVHKNVVFGLSKIPGNGQTTVLAAGFIFSSLLLKIQSLPPVPNTIRYLMVIDEAHRVAPFRAVQTMIREGRSKGLAVLLATQGPLDLPEVVAGNAQTKICFGLPDATIATMAARKLQPGNARLAEQIRTLGKGEAFVSFAGSEPRLIRMVQAYRDGPSLGLGALTPVSR